MELILALLVSWPLGYLMPTRRAALAVYLAAWAIVLPVQTILVHSENPDDLNWQYPVVQALILSLGLCLNRIGGAFRERRLAPAR
jgi:hypothetical protein